METNIASDPLQQGYEAAKAGVTLDANPYSAQALKISQEAWQAQYWTAHDAWARGWQKRTDER